ncbi:MAG: L,D-transpeptidase family protein [Gammaproteobacteria bacterium]|nr:L,D-transpeptidase family protein [Gammaproteobacteria bacterium]
MNHATPIRALRVLLPIAALAATIGGARPAPCAEAARPPLPPGRPVAMESAQVRAVHARHPGALWTNLHGLTPQGRALFDALEHAARFGLDPRDYASAQIESRLAAFDADRSSVERRADLERLLTHAAVRLLTHLHYGRVDPRAAGFEFTRARRDLDVAASVAALADSADPAAAIAAVEPRFYHYRLLLRALAKYRALAAHDPHASWPPLPRRRLGPGDVYAGVPVLRARLAAVGDLPANEASAPAGAQGLRLDAALIAALERFQARHGLAADGVLGRRTFAALTTPYARRVEQIDLTLERWRWLAPFTAPPIIVNIPQFRLFAFPTTADRAAGLLQMAVIVGQTYPRTRTPVFSGELRYVVFRPYWDVPRSITLREMLPEIRAHRNFLARNQLELVRGPADTSPVVPPSPDAIAALAAGSLRLRQRPGEDNALGLVKFIFPNAHDVFMHSTPAHHLFAASRRTFSHGCIRVSDPVALALYVLRNGPGVWDEARVRAAMQAGDDVRITLPKPVPVMILYGTALATEAGPTQFFDDVYGQDRRLAALLRRGSG